MRWHREGPAQRARRAKCIGSACDLRGDVCACADHGHAVRRVRDQHMHTHQPIDHMQNRHISLVVPAALALLSAIACNNDKLTSLNVNPNSPADVPVTTVFTNSARTAVSRWLGSGYDLRATEFVVQHLAEVQYPDEDDYKRLQASSTTTMFDNPYQSELEDFRKIIQKGEAAKDA